MFQRLWSHITDRKDRLLRHLMLAFLAGWGLLHFDLPGARAQRGMMGRGGGMMMRPTPSMTMRPMNANGMGFSGPRMGFSGAGMGFSGAGMGFPGMGFSGARMGYSGGGMGYSGGGMSGGYSGGGQYGSQNGYGDGGSTDSPLPRSLDGNLDGSSTSSPYSTSGSRESYGDGDSTSSRQAPRGRLLGEFIIDGYADGDSASSRRPLRGRLLGEVVTDSYADGDYTSSRRPASTNGGADQAQRAADANAREAADRRAAYVDSQKAREQAARAEEIRQQAEREQLEHSLHHPSAAEIRSGKALNDILADLQKRSATSGSAARGGLPLLLDKADLAHINVSARAGSIGLLRNAGHVNWPTALSGSDFAAERERLSRRTSEAIQKIKAGGLADGAALDELQGDVYRLYKRLRDQGTDFPPSQYAEGLIFLRDFQSAIKGLWQLDVANYFNGKYALKANTVADLVKHMTEQGLHFAPAVSGDEPAYAMLHGVLADYDRAVGGDRR